MRSAFFFRQNNVFLYEWKWYCNGKLCQVRIPGRKLSEISVPMIMYDENNIFVLEKIRLISQMHIDFSVMYINATLNLRIEIFCCKHFLSELIKLCYFRLFFKLHTKKWIFFQESPKVLLFDKPFLGLGTGLGSSPDLFLATTLELKSTKVGGLRAW